MFDANRAVKTMIEIKIGHLDESKPGSKTNIHTIVLPFEERPGFIYAVLDIRGSNTAAKKLHQIFEEHLDETAVSVNETSNFQHVFEQLLTDINKAIVAEDKKKNLDLDPQDFNVILGIASEDRMYLTGAGDMVGVFLHQKDRTRYQIYNLFRGIQTEQAVVSWDKIISVVLDGDLHDGDIFLAANREITKDVPKDDIMNVVSTLPPSGAVVKLRQYFPLKADLGLVVIKAQQTGHQTATADSSSVEDLERTTSETRRVLSDQKPNVKSGFMGLLITLGKILIAVTLLIVGLVVGLAKGSYHFVMGLIKGDHKTKIKVTKNKTDVYVNRVLNKFNRLPKTSKYILLAVLVIVFIFVVSLMFYSRAKVRQQEVAAYDESVVSIEAKRDEALASIIYQDENQARTLLLEALSLVENMDTSTLDRIEKKDALRAEIENALNELRHIEEVAEPTVLADLRSVEDTAGAGAIALTANGLFVITDNQAVYLVNQEAKSLEAVDTDESDAGAPVASGYDDTNNVVYFLDSRPGISKFDPDQNLLNAVTINLPGESFPDIEIYARRIYALSPASEQVLRYDRVGSGFGSGTPWILNKSTSLADAVSITIDGDIYIFKADGSFVKLADNEEVSWYTGVMDPELAGDGFIWSDDESKYLYLLEPSGKRVVVIEKESGTMNVQYHSENFNDLKDFIVDEENKKIYLLAGTQILVIDANHL